MEVIQNQGTILQSNHCARLVSVQKSYKFVQNPDTGHRTTTRSWAIRHGLTDRNPQSSN